MTKPIRTKLTDRERRTVAKKAGDAFDELDPADKAEVAMKAAMSRPLAMSSMLARRK